MDLKVLKIKAPAPWYRRSLSRRRRKPSLRCLIVTAVPWGVPRCVERPDLPPAEVNGIPLPQHLPRFPGENPAGKRGPFRAELPPHHGLRQGEEPEPVCRFPMDCGGGKPGAAADVIPVDVGQSHGNGEVCQGLYLPPQVPLPSPVSRSRPRSRPGRRRRWASSQRRHSRRAKAAPSMRSPVNQGIIPQSRPAGRPPPFR